MDLLRILAAKLFALFGLGIDVDDGGGFFNRLQTGNGFKQLLLTAPRDACNAKDLTAIGFEGNIVKPQNAHIVLNGEMLDF